MQKIVCLIRSDPAFFYFVNRIHERHKVSLVVVESFSFKRRLVTQINSGGIPGLVEALRNQVSRRINRKTYASTYDKHFGDRWRSLHPEIPVLRVDHINSPAVYERLKEERPDLILDHGTSIVKDHILETSALALNLHRGLSPYYRGTYCTERALINWDPHNIGVTIHKLTKIIDGGSILAQERPIIQTGDTVGSIDMQLTQRGTELIIKAIDKLDAGEELQFRKQDVSLGFLTVNRHWTKHLRKQIRHVERKGLIAEMLKKPARKKKLPIVEL
jgi:folate-dependent phosphoribosylglycinamide formyltransferase PurN